MSDLRDRVPAHSLIDELLRQRQSGGIHMDATGRRLMVSEEAEAWYRGALGERHVAAILSDLSDDWSVLHSIPIGKGNSDIDHVAIGPSGVYSINTKFSPGKKIWVGGYGMYVGGTARPHYVRNALLEAQRASEALSAATGLTVPVTGLIVFVDPASITHKAAAGAGEYRPTIEVIASSALCERLDSIREFSDEQIARIVEAAVRPETWVQHPKSSSHGAVIDNEFADLEAALGPQFGFPSVSTRPGARTSVREPRVSRKAQSRRGTRPASRARSKKAPRKTGRSRRERLITDLVLSIGVLSVVWAVLANR